MSLQTTAHKPVCKPPSKFYTSHKNKIRTIILSILEDPKDLIRKCLVVDPEKRITVSEALRHPFFQTMVSAIILYFPKYLSDF